MSRDFGPPVFFHHFNQPGPLTNGLKYFRIWFRFRRDIRILIAKKLTRRNKKYSILERSCKKQNAAL